MKEFKYTITDPVGLHARPAAILVKKVKEMSSTVTITSDCKSADASKLIAMMGLGVKQGMEVTVKVEGEDESTEAVELERFFQSNF